MKFSITLSLCLVSMLTFAQISGVVVDGATGEPIVGALIQWHGTEITTSTNFEGQYTIEKPSGATMLMASAPQFSMVHKSVISRSGTINFELISQQDINEVDVVAETDGTGHNFGSPTLQININQRELRKAACCNLSESFETNASVDVSFTDAVTGAKQIEMLGLSGKYVLVQRENVPFARGLNATSGISFIPGPFIGSIQLTKGLSSVVNGYESISGQINTEFLQPTDDEYFRLNGFINQGARFETNAWFGTSLTDQLDVGTLAHYSNVPFTQDKNGDGFADMPAGQQISVHNRWKYFLNEKWGGQVGFSVTADDRRSGQTGSEFDPPASGVNPWIFEQSNNRYEVFGKSGYIDPDNLNRSIGIVYSANIQNREAQVGLRSMAANQSSAYVNAIYQDVLGSVDHTIKAGLSYQYDNIDERLDSTNGPLLYQLERVESVPGAFAEYTYSGDAPVTLVAGARIDYHNLFGWLFTPRVNVKYEPVTGSVIRFGGGRGMRTPNIITENVSALASGRPFEIFGTGIQQEQAWNVGLSYSQALLLFDRGATFSVDGFYTWFNNKLIGDFYPTQTFFAYYNGDFGNSSSISAIAQVDFEPIEQLNVRIAYKYLNAQDAFIDGIQTAYRVPGHRAFLNVGYTFGESGWKVDATYNWFGAQRVPTWVYNEQTNTHQSPSFGLIHAQVNKTFGKNWEVYMGVDNLLDYRQANPIVAADRPFSSDFESNAVYAPIFGRMIYAGFYYNLSK